MQFFISSGEKTYSAPTQKPVFLYPNEEETFFSTYSIRNLLLTLIVNEIKTIFLYLVKKKPPIPKLVNKKPSRPIETVTFICSSN